MLSIKTFSFNAFRETCILAWDESLQAVIVDPGCSTSAETESLTSFIADKGLHPVKIVLTHAHFDHIFGVATLAARYGIPVLLNEADKVIIDNNRFFCTQFGLPVPDDSFMPSAQFVRDGDTILWGEDRKWEVISTPGHTPGGTCYLDSEARLLLSGDTLFAGSIGRTDNQWGDYDALIQGILGKLMVLDGDISVIPGHGPATTIADERTKNPFLMPFNEPYEEGKDGQMDMEEGEGEEKA